MHSIMLLIMQVFSNSDQGLFNPSGPTIGHWSIWYKQAFFIQVLVVLSESMKRWVGLDNISNLGKTAVAWCLWVMMSVLRSWNLVVTCYGLKHKHSPSPYTFHLVPLIFENRKCLGIHSTNFVSCVNLEFHKYLTKLLIWYTLLVFSRIVCEV